MYDMIYQDFINTKLIVGLAKVGVLTYNCAKLLPKSA